MGPVRSPASFRDPSGYVYLDDGRVLRTIGRTAAPAYEYVRDRGLLRRWIDCGWLVDSREAPASEVGELVSEAPAYLLEHERIPFVSYPYEWSFGALKSAALLHLDLQRDALQHGVELSDASAYNVQFSGAHPVFIDVLSFRPYPPGGYWTAHRQFCHQFLNPLLLRALAGVPHNAWFRGALDGIPTTELNRLLPAARKLSWNVFSHVTLPARMEAKLARQALAGATRAPRRPLPKAAYAGLLDQLRRWIARLEPRGQARTTWSEYETGHTYRPEERNRKRAFVETFVREERPAVLWDLGCNTGEYSELALHGGARVAIGFEGDHGALERAFDRATTRTLAFVPLYLDAANPSPDQGWNQEERNGLAARGPADAVLALAFAHHLAIGRNVPLDRLLDWLTACAPAGVIEFVPKTDPTVQRMLANREDIFREYTWEAFTSLLSARARIGRSEVISAAGRWLVVYDRR